MDSYFAPMVESPWLTRWGHPFDDPRASPYHD